MELYLNTDGAEGHLWDSEPFGGTGKIPTLLLTTSDRESGEPLQLPLIYISTPEGWAVIASKGGSATHPGWYENLKVNPNVEVQIKNERFPAQAHTTVGAERDSLWKKLADLYPPFNSYVPKAAPREIPLVLLKYQP